MIMPDMRKLNEMLRNVPPDTANAVQHVAVEMHLQLDRVSNSMRSEYEDAARDSVMASFDAASRMTAIELGMNKTVHYAPPGLTDPAANAQSNPPVALPTEIAELSYNATTGKLEFKRRTTRHVMGSLMSSTVDETYTALAAMPGIMPGTAIGQMLYWDSSKWATVAAGAEGKFLKSNGAGMPGWDSPVFALPYHATSHMTGGDDAIALARFVASVVEGVPGASVDGLLRGLPDPARSDYDKLFLGPNNTWVPWYIGTANPYDMLRQLPIYGTGENANVVVGWDWQPFVPDMADMQVWFGENTGEAWIPAAGNDPGSAGEPWLMMVAKPVSVTVGEAQQLAFQGKIVTVAEALLAMEAANKTDAWPKYLRMVPAGAAWRLEWEDLEDTDMTDSTNIKGMACFLGAADTDENRLVKKKLTENSLVKWGTNGPEAIAIPSEITKFLDGTGNFVVPPFAPAHSHPYALDNHGHTLANMLAWMTGLDANATDTLNVLVMKPVDTGLGVYKTEASPMTIETALLGAGISRPAGLFPKYLRIKKVGEVETLEWEDICDETNVSYTLPYWMGGADAGKLGVIPVGSANQVLKFVAGAKPEWATPEDFMSQATTSKKGLLPALLTDDPATKFLASDGQWTTLPNASTSVNTKLAECKANIDFLFSAFAAHTTIPYTPTWTSVWN